MLSQELLLVLPPNLLRGCRQRCTMVFVLVMVVVVVVTYGQVLVPMGTNMLA